jgi:hypothetical protein
MFQTYALDTQKFEHYPEGSFTVVTNRCITLVATFKDYCFSDI